MYIPERDADGSIKSLVKTEFEREDIILKLASTEGTFTAGQCVLQIKVPGTPGTDVRYAAGGYAFTDNFTFGDRCKLIEVVDVDNILGYGAGTVLKTYHDDGASDFEMGWRMYPTYGGHGEIEIDPLGFYGTIPSGLYLKITFLCVSSTKAAADIWWGGQE